MTATLGTKTPKANGFHKVVFVFFFNGLAFLLFILHKQFFPFFLSDNLTNLHQQS